MHSWGTGITNTHHRWGAAAFTRPDTLAGSHRSRGARLQIGKLLLGLLLLGIPAVLTAETSSASGSSLEELRERLEEAGYSEGSSALLMAELEEARDREIPFSLLTPRLFEGIAKQIPLPRITSVIDEEIALLTRAREVLRTAPSGDAFLQEEHLWQRTAHLLEKGLSVAEIHHLVTLCSNVPSMFRPSSALYLSLDAWGLQSQDTRRVIAALVQSPIPPREFAAVPRLFNRARAQRISPERLSDRIVQTASSVDSIRALERRILKE